MQKIIKQTVYLPVEEKFKGADYLLKDWSDDTVDFVDKTEGYFFTPEQLNEYTANVIKQALDTASKNAKTYRDKEFYMLSNVSKKSITNTFEESYKKF